MVPESKRNVRVEAETRRALWPQTRMRDRNSHAEVDFAVGEETIQLAQSDGIGFAFPPEVRLDVVEKRDGLGGCPDVVIFVEFLKRRRAIAVVKQDVAHEDGPGEMGGAM